MHGQRAVGSDYISQELKSALRNYTKELCVRVERTRFAGMALKREALRMLLWEYS